MESLPPLKMLAEDVIAFIGAKQYEELPWENPIEDARERADYMVRTYLLLQFEHLRSVLTLVNGGHDRDSSIIARTMAEGFTQLAWALRSEPWRTDQWFWYEVVLERFQILDNQESGVNVTNEDLKVSSELIQKYGHQYFNQETREAIDEDQPLPEDERQWYRYTWHAPRISTLFRKVPNNSVLFRFWRSASAWAHWSPISVFRAMDKGQGPFHYDPEDLPTAARSLAVAINCTINTLALYNNRFSTAIEDEDKIMIQNFSDRFTRIVASDS